MIDASLPDASLPDASLPDANPVDANLAPDQLSCQADCECRLGIDWCCLNGKCASGDQKPLGCEARSLRFCYGGGDAGVCPCVGGTCDSRHCCLLPDGGIDNGLGALIPNVLPLKCASAAIGTGARCQWYLESITRV